MVSLKQTWRLARHRAARLICAGVAIAGLGFVPNAFATETNGATLLVQVEAQTPQQAAAFSTAVQAFDGASQALVLLATQPASAQLGDLSGDNPPSLLVQLNHVNQNSERAALTLVLCQDDRCDVPQLAGPALLISDANPEQLGRVLRQALTLLPRAKDKATNTLTAGELTALLQRSFATRRLNTHPLPDWRLDTSGFVAQGDDRQMLVAEQLEAKALLDGQAPQEALLAYLETCRFCPQRNSVSQRVSAMDQQGNQEAEFRLIWEATLASASPDTLRLSLRELEQSCQYVAYVMDTSRTQEAEISTAIERGLWDAAKQSQDATCLQAVMLACDICDFGEASDDQALIQAQGNDAIAALLAQEAESLASATDTTKAPLSAQEQSLLEKLEGPANRAVLETYVATCQDCSQKEQVGQRLEALIAAQTRVDSCLDLSRPVADGGDGVRKAEAKAVQQACSILDDPQSLALAELPQGAQPLMRMALAEALRLSDDLAGAQALYQDLFDQGYTQALPGLVLSLFSGHAAGSEGRVKLDQLLARFAAPGTAQYSEPRIALVRALVTLEGLSGGQRLLDQPALIADLQRAAEAGEADAHFLLGVLYARGHMVGQDMRQAAVHFRQGAALGHAESMAYFGDHLELSLGVQGDYQLAAELYYDALKLGSPWAYQRLYEQGRSRPLAVMEAVQRLMKRDGFYRGSTDGLFGPSTRTSLSRAFESDKP